MRVQSARLHGSEVAGRNLGVGGPVEAWNPCLLQCRLLVHHLLVQLHYNLLIHHALLLLHTLLQGL